MASLPRTCQNDPMGFVIPLLLPESSRTAAALAHPEGGTRATWEVGGRERLLCPTVIASSGCQAVGRHCPDMNGQYRCHLAAFQPQKTCLCRNRKRFMGFRGKLGSLLLCCFAAETGTEAYRFSDSELVAPGVASHCALGGQELRIKIRKLKLLRLYQLGRCLALQLQSDHKTNEEPKPSHRRGFMGPAVHACVLMQRRCNSISICIPCFEAACPSFPHPREAPHTIVR